MKIRNPDRQFVYFSPLKDCENASARQLASVVEKSLLENIALQIEFAECRIKQIYQYAEKLMNSKEFMR